MKTQHLYFRRLSNMDVSIKILFLIDNCILHIPMKRLLDLHVYR